MRKGSTGKTPKFAGGGEKEQHPNNKKVDDVQIVYSKPPAPPVPDVKFQRQPEAGGPSLQVKGNTELIPPSTSCPKDAPTSKAPVKYKMKAVREKPKKKNTRRRAAHLKDRRRYLKAIWGTTA